MAWFLAPAAMKVLPKVLRSRHLWAFVGILGVLLACWYVYYRIDLSGYNRGYAEMETLHEKQMKMLREMYDKRLTDQASIKADVEEGLRNAIAVLHVTYRQQMDKVKEDAETAIANHKSGAGRLSINTVPSTSTSTSNTGAPGTCSGNDGSSERRELAPEAAEFLIREAEYATQLAAQLTSCQGTVRAYLERTKEYNERIKLLHQQK